MRHAPGLVAQQQLRGSAPRALPPTPLWTQAQSLSSFSDGVPELLGGCVPAWGSERRGFPKSYVTRLRQRRRESACSQPAAAVQYCYSCGASGGGQGSRPVHSCTALDKSPSGELGHCVASPRKETREMDRESTRRHREKSPAQSRLHLSRVSRALGPDVFRLWKASGCRRLESARTRAVTWPSLISHTGDPGLPRCHARSKNFMTLLPRQLPERSPFGLGS